ncbi:hypothetical protein ACFL2O_05165 [Thermodesulfobacteriota bacterium]
MLKRLFLFIIVTILFGTGKAALAGETDNYYAWGKVINDSAELFNKYLKKKINAILLEVINPNELLHGQSHCQQVVLAVMENLGTSVTIVRHPALNTELEIWAESNKEIDRAPSFGTTADSYISKSLFAPGLGALEKKFVSIDPTINIGGIYFGTDKLSHFLGSGYLYYKTYLGVIKNSGSETAAFRAAILSGCKMETGILGMQTTGVFSFADLEANFQGMVMAIDFCRKSDPILQFKSDIWVLGSLDIRDYVSPNWDETENVSVYNKKRWDQVRRNMVNLGYCRFLKSQWLKRRKIIYKKYKEKDGGRAARFPSYSFKFLKSIHENQRSVREGVSVIQIPSQIGYHIEEVCGCKDDK